ncbi:MAG: response regulator transcription factor [Acidimicrobiales bacterium]|nr:response regulator transcription factor [Acidimicrobiales bacterium]MBO0885996.1 response regulator transcription factor [Acidimicrobiales bacterium]
MRLLVADDDDDLRRVLVRGLEAAGYVVDAVADGHQAVAYLKANEYGACVLDWRMPGLSGLEVVAWIRQQGVPVPVLMLTAKDTPRERVQGLDEGADDYLVKPFHYPELLARLRALLRRPGGERQPVLRTGGLLLDPASRVVKAGDEPVELTPRELAILELLMRRAPEVVTRRSIALQAWPDEADAVGSNTIDVHMARLRGKLARGQVRVETVRGTGYRLVGP